MEIVDIMMVLYDEEEIMCSYIESEVYGAKNKKRDSEKAFTDEKLSYGEIIVASELAIEDVKKLAEIELV